MTGRSPTVLIAPGDGGRALELFIPLAGLLRSRGYEVRFFSSNIRDRLQLRRHRETVCEPFVPGHSTELPELVATAAAVRGGLARLQPGSRGERSAQSIWRAAQRAVADADVVVVWNGSDLQTAAISQAAQTKGLTVWHLENGLIPGAVQCDRSGVNAAASLAPGASRPGVGTPLSPTPSGQIDGPDGHFRAPGLVQRLAWTVTEWIEATFAPERARLTTKARLRDMRGSRQRKVALPGDAEPLPERFIFLPLQVYDDSNLWRHGGWVDSMDTLCRAVRDAAGDVPVVARQHPMDIGRTDYEGLMERYPEFLWTRTRALGPCMEHAETVVTVNSTVGFEALALGKAVVVCGRSVYGHDDACYAASEPSKLRDQLNAAIESGQAPSGAATRWQKIASELHVEIDRYVPDRAGLQRLADRILSAPVAEHRQASSSPQSATGAHSNPVDRSNGSQVTISRASPSSTSGER